MLPTYPDPSAEFSAVKPTTTAGRFVQFPITRLIIALVFLYLPFGVGLLLKYFRDNYVPDEWADTGRVVGSIIVIATLLYTYHLYCRFVERRKAVELLSKGAVPEFINGLGLGAGLVGLSTAVVMLLASVTIQSGSENWTTLFTQFFLFAGSALWEEILFRLILFRLTEEWLGSWPAILIQAVLFGFAHGGNPGATVWSSVSIVLSAGALLSAIFMLTRRIWMVWGVHIFWNYFQSAIMGLPVSGGESSGILSTQLTGPTWITGGEFGIEASALTVLIVLVTGIVFFRIVILNRRVVLSLRSRRALFAKFAAGEMTD